MSATTWWKFYPSDWRADLAVRMCSVAARGLWLEMLCVMHEAAPRGSLVFNGQAMTDRQIASMAGISLKECQALMEELDGAGVYSRDADGTIFNRRMRRDTAKAAEDKANGSLGGNPQLKGGLTPRVKAIEQEGDKAQIPDTRDQRKESESRTKPARRRFAYSTEFEEFWNFYPTDSLMSKKKAFEAWAKQTPEDQAAITASVPAFRRHCSANPDYRPVHAVRYITERRFDGFIALAQRFEEGVYLKRSDPEWGAWERHYRETQGRSAPTDANQGWRFPSRLPPAAAAEEIAPKPQNGAVPGLTSPAKEIGSAAADKPDPWADLEIPAMLRRTA